MTHAANDFVLHDSFPTSGFGSSEEFLNAVAIAKKNPEKWVEYPVALDHSSIASARKAASEIRPWPFYVFGSCLSFGGKFGLVSSPGNL